MKVLNVLIFLLIGVVITCSSGCELLQPFIDQAATEPDPEATGLSEDEAREKAIAIVKRMFQRAREAVAEAEAEGQSDADIEEIIFQIQLEETGLDEHDSVSLLDIHLEENPEDIALAQTVGFVNTDLIVEYLVLSLQSPEKSKEELMELFREAARNGKTEVHPMLVLRLYDFILL